MKNFKGKVAVITGAASGIARGIARKCVERGIKVMLADIEEKPLENTKKELEAVGGIVQTSITDVSKLEDIKDLAKKTVDKYGAIHLLFNKIGKNIFRELKGSFALVISDKEGDIYLARDVMGIKPLYYSKNEDTLIFASELKSIIEFGKNIKEVSVDKEGSGLNTEYHVMPYMAAPVEEEVITEK